MRYKFTVTVTRVRISVVVLWVFSITVGFCSTVRVIRALIPAAAVILVASLVILIFLYVKSFKLLRIYCMQVKPEEVSTAESSTEETSKNGFKRAYIDIRQYRRALKTMVLVFVMIILCYIPAVYVLGFTSFAGVNRSTTIALNYATLIVNMKSLVNPVLYVVRMKEVRDACVHFLRKVKFTG